MSVAFRNVEVGPDVETWPYEAIVTALERGTIRDWAVLGRAIARRPWGQVARQVEDYLAYADDAAIRELFRRRIAGARADQESAERAEVAELVREYVEASGLSRAAFAQAIGTSRSRLSTYCSGRVVPSATLLVRMRQIGGVGAR